jgi:hypothetical protein
MTSARNFLITATLAVGMTAAGAGTAFAAAPTTAAPAVQSVAFTQPSDWNNDNDNWDHDRGGDRDRGNWGWDRNRNGGWWGNRNHWGVSPQQCRWGGGRIDWSNRKCRGGRFGGERLRWGW